MPRFGQKYSYFNETSTYSLRSLRSTDVIIYLHWFIRPISVLSSTIQGNGCTKTNSETFVGSGSLFKLIRSLSWRAPRRKRKENGDKARAGETLLAPLFSLSFSFSLSLFLFPSYLTLIFYLSLSCIVGCAFLLSYFLRACFCVCVCVCVRVCVLCTHLLTHSCSSCSNPRTLTLPPLSINLPCTLHFVTKPKHRTQRNSSSPHPIQ